MSKPLIIHVIDELSIGGAQTFLKTILEEAQKSKHYQHNVICLFGEGGMHKELERLNISVQFMHFEKLLHQKKYFYIIQTLKKIFKNKKPSVVEAHLSWSRFFALPAAFFAKVPSRVGFEHGDIYLNSIKFKIANFVTQFFAQNIIVCSQALSLWNQKHNFLLKKKLYVLHNCINPESFIVRRKINPEKEWNTAKGSTLICAVGTLGKGVNKRVDICIEALQLLLKKQVSASLVICGDGELKPLLEQQAQDLGIRKQVHFLGMRKDVADIMSVCDIFWHSAPFEPFGIVALEAMWSYLPIVVPKSGGIQEIIPDQKEGVLYEPLNPNDLALKTESLIKNPEHLKKLSIQAHNTVKEKFLVSQYVEKLYKLY